MLAVTEIINILGTSSLFIVYLSVSYREQTAFSSAKKETIKGHQSSTTTSSKKAQSMTNMFLSHFLLNVIDFLFISNIGKNVYYL